MASHHPSLPGGATPLALHPGLSTQRPAAPQLSSPCFSFLVEVEGLLPESFFPWDMLCVQMNFTICTTFLWQGVWVNVEVEHSFTDVRREFRFEAGVYSTFLQLVAICSWAAPHPNLCMSRGASQSEAESQRRGLGSGSGLGLP